jgi:hypothetical protein
MVKVSITIAISLISNFTYHYRSAIIISYQIISPLLLLILGVKSHQYALYLRLHLRNPAMLSQKSRSQYGLEVNSL